jgi:hypothetical protein
MVASVAAGSRECGCRPSASSGAEHCQAPRIRVLAQRAPSRCTYRRGAANTQDRGVHVTNILRKLDVSNRVQAAAIAERAGLAHTGPPETLRAGI